MFEKGWIRGQVVVRNIGEIPLTDVYVNINVDDDGDYWDGILVINTLLQYFNFNSIILLEGGQ